jgi:exonuclease VII small subunit
MNKQRELQKQVEMLTNGIETFNVPQNHMEQAEVELEEIEKGIVRLKEHLQYTKRGMELVREAIEESKNNIEKLIC